MTEMIYLVVDDRPGELDVLSAWSTSSQADAEVHRLQDYDADLTEYLDVLVMPLNKPGSVNV